MGDFTILASGTVPAPRALGLTYMIRLDLLRIENSRTTINRPFLSQLSSLSQGKYKGNKQRKSRGILRGLS